MKKYKLAVVIGRFQPVHNGHINLFKEAEALADNVLVVIGSSFQARTPKNPFTYSERETLINQIFPKFTCCPAQDNIYDNDSWALSVDREISQFIRYMDINSDREVVIVGHTKDESSFYLSMFPQYDQYEASNLDHLNATDIRAEYFTTGVVNGNIPKQTVEFLKSFAKNQKEEYESLVEYHKFNNKNKAMWANTPYPVLFQTVDAVVVRSNHVLLVKRKHQPGKGLWALPGGYLNINETLLNGAIRELQEETGLDIPKKILYNCLVESKRFDDPNRSERGRVISDAFYFRLPPGKLDRVKGSDDAEKAEWVHLNKIDPELLFEDHASIISYFLG